MEIAIGIVVFVRINEEGWEQTLTDTIKTKFDLYANTSDSVLRDAVNNLQRDLECCGDGGPTDWQDRGVDKPPPGCCINPDPPCTSFEPHQVFQDGCMGRLMQLLEDSIIVLAILAIAVGVIQIIGVVFALCLASSIRNRE